jgi:hypothetical protein
MQNNPMKYILVLAVVLVWLLFLAKFLTLLFFDVFTKNSLLTLDSKGIVEKSVFFLLFLKF